MFESVERGRKVAKRAFKKREAVLRTGLLRAQHAAAERKIPILIIVAGVEGAGRGQIVDRLNAWMDTRGIVTHAFWDESNEERDRPRYWRFWRCMPRRDQLAIMFGSWYTQPIFERAMGESGKGDFDREMHRISELEQMLTLDGALMIKLWFHLSKRSQARRLKAESEFKHSPFMELAVKNYDALASAAERAIRLTDNVQHPWVVIEAQDPRYRDLTAGQAILDRLNTRLAARGLENDNRETREGAQLEDSTILDQLDLSASLEEEQYEKKLEQYQSDIYKRAWTTHNERVNVVAVFEGWDAAGKGSAIRRLTQAIDARLYHVITVGAPTDEELAHHYLWRFWRHVPRAGEFTIYDRSWYGRVLVERVEGLAQPTQWRRAYREINDFEEQLVDHGIVLMKYWIHISPDEQLARFREREETPWKQHKITRQDWRNREKWDAYERAVNEMIARTSTEHAPWTLIAGNDKKYARIRILEEFRERLGAALD
ncbi:MAG: polyphosphate:AMP phosphotransferase [Pseudomonadales bacterium]